MENFPSNSQNVTGKKPPTEEKPKKDIQKVTEGVVIKKPKSLGRRFKDIFFDGQFKGATAYVATDVLLPAVKNMIVDATTRGIERVIYGDAGPRRRSPMGLMDTRQPRVQYNSPVNRNYSPNRGMLPDQPPQALRRKQDIGDIILASREDGSAVLEQMGDIIEAYDVVSLADLYETLGLPSSHTDNKWGWSSLHSAGIHQTRDGFLLDLPPIEPI